MNKKFNSVDILGVRVDKVTMNQAVNLVESWLKGTGKHYIVTPNIEFVMAAQKDPEFRKVLNQANLAIPDGFGLKLARFARRAADIQSTISGVDLMEDLIRVAAEKSYTVGFLGGKGEVAKKCAECLSKKYPGLKVAFAESGGKVDSDGLQLTANRLQQIENSGQRLAVGSKLLAVDILFVAFGQIKQEKWIAKNLPKIPVKVAMGVGGSFDELSGAVPRIPRWVHQIGLKWLVRLILQPWRIKRQMALVKFVWMVLCRGTS